MKSEKSGTGILLILLFFVCFPGFSAAADADPESYYVIDRLLSMTGPGAPEIIDDSILFTYTSACRRVGIAFAHEGFSRVHWFRLLLVPQDPLTELIAATQKKPELYKDSGILFFVYQIPEDARDLEYRMVIDGLWTVDPANPASRRNAATGLEYSVLYLPARQYVPDVLKGPPGTASFTFQGPPGETVTVAGSFNGWDPFMYELKEGPAGTYSLNLPLPPGKHQYIFFHRGERRLDSYNPQRAYTREGMAASEVVLR